MEGAAGTVNAANPKRNDKLKGKISIIREGHCPDDAKDYGCSDCSITVRTRVPPTRHSLAVLSSATGYVTIAASLVFWAVVMCC